MKTNRDALIVIALRLFLTKGFDQTSMQDLARASGLSKGAFHHYFPRKHDILDACLQRFFGDFLPDAQRPEGEDIVRFALHCAERHAAALCELTSQGIPLSAFQAFLWAQLRDRPDEMRAYQARVLAQFEQGFEARFPGRGRELARQVFALIEGTGVMLSVVPPPDPEDLRTIFRQVVGGFLAGIRG